MSLSPALVRDIYPRSQLGHAFGLNAMYTNIAAGVGADRGRHAARGAPVAVALRDQLPVAGVIVLCARDALPDVDRHRRAVRPRERITSAVGFSMLVYGLDGFARHEPLPLIAARVVVGGVCCSAGSRAVSYAAVPMISLDLFRLPRFSVAAQASFSGWSAWSIGIITLPFFLQLELGMSPLASGLLMTSWPIANAVVAPITGDWSDRYAVGWIATGGLVGFTFALLVFLYAVIHPSVALLFVAGFWQAAVGHLRQTPNNRELMGAGPPEKSGSTAAIFASREWPDKPSAPRSPR